MKVNLENKISIPVTRFTNWTSIQEEKKEKEVKSAFFLA